MSERFELRMGKFGAYYYDRKTKRDLTLKEVLFILNGGEWAI